MTEKEAIETLQEKSLERCEAFGFDCGNCDKREVTIAYDMAIKALENQMQKNSAEREKTTCPFCGRPVGVSNVTLSTYGIDPPIYCNKCGRALWRRCR